MKDILIKEFETFQREKPNESWGEVITNDYSKWRIHFYGPPNSDYEEGKFNIRIEFSDYPKCIPTCYFEHKDLFHPNINNKAGTNEGWACFGEFEDNWKKIRAEEENKKIKPNLQKLGICAIIEYLYYILKFPGFKYPWDKRITEAYEDDEEGYHLMVKHCVKQYAHK